MKNIVIKLDTPEISVLKDGDKEAVKMVYMSKNFLYAFVPVGAAAIAVLKMLEKVLRAFSLISSNSFPL